MTKASCTTHVVKDESEAVQMFIFQNNRGKKPTNLEIIKAQFMYDIHLYVPVEDKQNLLSEITERFEHIYKSISKIEGNIDEDNVLNYTIKVYRNSLDEINSTDFVNKELGKADSCISFIRKFTQLLSSCFSQISNFLDETKKNITYHALLIAADRSIMFPFVIKALLKGMPQKELEELARALEQIFLRHRIIGTRANLLWRLNDSYKMMGNGAKNVVNHIQWMKSRKDWWGYWNNDELLRTLNMGMNHNTAKILLWKYENHLIQCGKAGYKVLRYDDIEQPHLEHIAPQTENKEPNNGYCPYDEDFYNRYLECLGNYLLLSGSHNMSLSNERFQKKRESYTYLQQQREVLGMTEKDPIWDKDKIQQRHSKIIDYLMQIL
ncbi:HNH endonuclease family protein [Prevotella jejuni]|uniref:HNH endonuclease family protein n=1 Tax=Prevotella jejuni TaxID=1177574 RepID=UPI002013AB99|nr:HNH endonuclease family protein [Prevotella jejuni]